MATLLLTVALCGQAPPAPAATTRATTRAATAPASRTAAAASATAPATQSLVAREPSPEVLKQVEGIIRGLSSETWKERQVAQEKLVSFGEDAILPLRRVLERTRDEEVRTRAGAALRAIEENAQVGATLITIKVKDARPQDVFEEIARQARFELNVQPKNMWTMRTFPTITMDLERVNFWTAFKQACQKAGVSPVTWGNQSGITLQPHAHVQWDGPTDFSGPFMIVANRIHRTSAIDLANPMNVQRGFELQLTVFSEPKLKVLHSYYEVNVDEAVDDKGNNLDKGQQRSGGGMTSGSQWAWNLTARLTWPDAPGTVVKRFKGSARFTVQVKSETLDVPQIAQVKNLTRTVAGRRILIKELKQNGNQCVLHATMYRDRLSASEWDMMQGTFTSLQLLDKEGHPLNRNGWGGGGSAQERSYQWTFSRESWGPDNEKTGDPFRLVWEIPVETRDITAGFEFKDLPMPK